MPAKKDSSLRNRHDTIATRTERESAEADMRPRTPLRETPPAQLRGHKTAWSTWKRLYDLYHSAKVVLVTSYDEDILTTYCLLIEEIYDDIPSTRESIKETIQVVKDKLKTVEDEDLRFKYTQEITKLFEKLKGVEGTLNARRNQLHNYQQSLYLTPRTRAGVTPEEKTPDTDPTDPMSEVLSKGNSN